MKEVPRTPPSQRVRFIPAIRERSINRRHVYTKQHLRTTQRPVARHVPVEALCRSAAGNTGNLSETSPEIKLWWGGVLVFPLVGREHHCDRVRQAVGLHRCGDVPDPLIERRDHSSHNPAVPCKMHHFQYKIPRFECKIPRF